MREDGTAKFVRKIRMPYSVFPFRKVCFNTYTEALRLTIDPDHPSFPDLCRFYAINLMHSLRVRVFICDPNQDFSSSVSARYWQLRKSY